jgi:thiamine-phosphate pyrophosphorylase
VPVLAKPLSSLNRPLVCYVTDRHTLAAIPASENLRALIQKVQVIVSAGIDWVQLREKDLSAKELTKLTRESLRYARQVYPSSSERPRILINDRLDVAIAERAGGVHLGEQSLAVAEVRRFVEAAPVMPALGDGFLVGVSCHSREAAQSAARSGADYIFFGPVFATPSKAAYGLPQGLERLSEVCRAVAVPVLAIGGVTLENAGSCVAAGAAGIAAIRLFQDAVSPAQLVAALHGV